jgi:hypothetical protein
VASVSATDIDPRLVVLLRAAAKLDLVDACLEDLDRAFDDIVDAVLVVEPCACEREMLDRFERYDREQRQRRRR